MGKGIEEAESKTLGLAHLASKNTKKNDTKTSLHIVKSSALYLNTNLLKTNKDFLMKKIIIHFPRPI